MKVAVVGSRNLFVQNIGDYLPAETAEIVSGGAKGIDACAKAYALQNHLKLTEFLPEYHKYSRAAPLKRNERIVEYADYVLAFWDGKSRGTKYVVDCCKKNNTPVEVIMLSNGTP